MTPGPRVMSLQQPCLFWKAGSREFGLGRWSACVLGSSRSVSASTASRRPWNTYDLVASVLFFFDVFEHSHEVQKLLYLKRERVRPTTQLQLNIAQVSIQLRHLVGSAREAFSTY